MPQRIAQIMNEHLDLASRENSFDPIVTGMRNCLSVAGVGVERIQLPMTKRAGFRHPTFWAVIVTWSHDNGFTDSFVLTHAERRRLDDELGVPPESADFGGPPIDSPFRPLFEGGLLTYRVRLDLNEPREPVLKELRSKGLVDYLALAVNVPGMDFPQYMSIASKRPFPDDVDARVEGLLSTFGMAIYGACRTSQVRQIASAYLGSSTGKEVLRGAISRGHTTVINAGIMFCDVRGFTALSERIEGRGIVATMNAVFEVIGDHATEHGGEILKFIGDAMLIVYRTEGGNKRDVANAMVQTVSKATASLSARATDDHAIEVGFGCHIGDVVYGNIGTPTRLDFTVMGSAVNLASRLESLTKELASPAAFSSEVAQLVEGLTFCGEYRLKGIHNSVGVFKLGPAQSSKPPTPDPPYPPQTIMTNQIDLGVETRSLIYGTVKDT